MDIKTAIAYPDIEKMGSNAVPGQEWSLLISRLEAAPFNDEGKKFVEKACWDQTFYHSISPPDALRVARVLQQHGLHEIAIEIMEWFNRKHPDVRELWQEHLEMLMLLGRRRDMLRLRARAAEHVPEELLSQWIKTGSYLTSDANSFEEPDNNEDEPFAALRREESSLNAYMEIFSGRRELFARQWADSNEQRQGYVPVKRPMTSSDVKEHIEGRKTYGIYLLDKDSSVRVGVIDIDLVISFREGPQMKKNRELIRREAEYLFRRFADMASDAGLNFIPEASGGKGYHIWFPVSEPVSAGQMRCALQGMVNLVKNDVKAFSIEVFPKQDRLTGKGFGNLVKLPLGIHRVTGKRSWIMGAKDRDNESQLEFLRNFTPSAPDAIKQLASLHSNAEILIHPGHAAWVAGYKELSELEMKCPMMGQLFATARSGKSLSVREEKVLLGTISHLSKGRAILHHIMSMLPEYNRHLLDYKISKVRGTPLGCKRIHSLLDLPNADLPCAFDGSGYPHPLKHLKEYMESEGADLPVSERVTNLNDAISNLKTAISMVEKFI